MKEMTANSGKQSQMPLHKFHLRFIDVFPSSKADLRMNLGQALDDLDRIPNSFCGAAWFPKTFDFSHLSSRVEDIFGYPYERYFDLGVLFLHSLIPTDLVPSMNSQMLDLISKLSSPDFNIQSDRIFEVTGVVNSHDGDPVHCTESLIILDQDRQHESFFFVGSWWRTDVRTIAEIQDTSNLVGDLLRKVKSIYHKMNEQHLLITVSPKEAEVLTLLSKGHTTKEISCMLGISFHTVESHRKNLLQKFEAKNTVELMSKIRDAER